jgi:hypothetical protein
MECTLAALLYCFSWANLYLDTHVSYIDAKQYRQEWYESAMVLDRDQGPGFVALSSYRNPYGGLAIGLALPLKDITLSVEASHFSSLATDDDRGINAVSLRARWFPFRR